MEYIDIYDDGLNHLGIKERDQAHRDGDWHHVFQAWVLATEAEQPALIFQIRASSKAIFPQRLDTTAAGHINAGETMRDGIREVHEELGLPIGYDDLIYLGRRMSTSLYADLIDREVSHIHLLDYQHAWREIPYDAEEVAGLTAITLENALQLFSYRVDAIVAPVVGVDEAHRRITRDDFVPHHDNYNYKVAIVACNYLRGDQHLAI